MRFLLDTNVLSEGFRPQPDPVVQRWLDSVPESSLLLSVVTIAEISRGVELLPPSRRRDAVAQWLENDLIERLSNRLVVLDTAIAKTWGAVMARARRSGGSPDVVDGFLAATALCHDLTVATRNVRHFETLGTPTVNPWTI